MKCRRTKRKQTEEDPFPLILKSDSMKQIHIPATLPKPIPVATKLFSVNVQYGRTAGCRLHLTPIGEYGLEVIGPTSDGVVRRTEEYKKAVRAVTIDMVHSYENATRSFTCMHSKMPKVETRSSYELMLNAMAPKEYARRTVALPMPTKYDIEDDLTKEAQALNYTSDAVKNYVKQHLNAMVERRQQAWIEAKELFDKMENARAERENAQLYAEHRSLYDKRKTALEGNPQDVYEAMIALPSQVTIPFNVNLEFDYNKEKGLLTANALVEDGLGVPQNKADILTSGKLSVKNKLVREVTDDVTNCTLSLTYLLASHLFNVSCNIQTLRLSLFNWRPTNPLLFVEFDRDSFARINPQQVDLRTDILQRPNVIYFKRKNDALEISTWDPKQFDDRVQSLCAGERQLSRAELREEMEKPIAKLTEIINSLPQKRETEVEASDREQSINFDPIIRDVATVVVKSQIASASYIQRTFEIGYQRAKRILLQLEIMGIVSEADYRLNRTVLVKSDEDLEAILDKFGL